MLSTSESRIIVSGDSFDALKETSKTWSLPSGDSRRRMVCSSQKDFMNMCMLNIA